MSENKKKKAGIFGRLFGGKTEDDKRAAEAAELAEKQKQVDAQMAARMAAINAAALKSAREQDERAVGTALDARANEEVEKRIEAEERAAAERQAQHDLEAAKRLEREKQEQAAQREAERLAAQKAEQDRLEAEAARVAAEKAALEKALQEKGEREASALKARQEAQAKARAEAEAEELAEHARLQAEEKARERARIEAYAREKAERERAAIEKIKQERAAAEVKALQGKREAEKQRAVAMQSDADGFLDRISGGLKKSTARMSDSMSALFTKRKLDDEAIEELEDLLVASDLGIGPSSKVTALLSADKFDKQVTDTEIKVALADVISDILVPLEKPLVLSDAKPQILLFVGVNGSGKTTTLGKLAKRYSDQGKKVLLAAGDTFRAAAVEQLTVWGERSGAPVMSAKIGADAAGLVYDAIDRAKRENFDILMIDTAGRLQNRTELMDELSKIVRVIKKQDPDAPHHCVLVLDATVGQNALSQTEAFKETAGVTGLIMTKLDGTAKGGVLVALSDKYKLPIHAIGIGERIEDLENFSAPVFAAALSGVADMMAPKA